MLIFVAEVGDKTQLLVAALAGRFPLRTVFLGITTGIAAVQAVAVAAGHLLGGLMPMGWLHLVSGAAFLGFSVWALQDEGSEALAIARINLNPFLAIACSFFLAELGDKTQLAAVALSARFPQPVHVWAGAVAGMVAADSLGLLAGYTLAQRVDRRLVRLASSLAFLAFAAYTLCTAAFGLPVKTVALLVATVTYLAAILSHWKSPSNRAKPRKE